MEEKHPLNKDIRALLQLGLQQIKEASELSQLDQIRIDYLGKKGRLTAYLKQINELPVELKPVIGQVVNEVKQQLQAAIDVQLEQLKDKHLEQQIKEQSIDITLPGKGQRQGAIHPITTCRLIIENFFERLGFEVIQGPEIETDYYNFTALNIPSNHPARAMHDTFYFEDGTLLRTHTSPVQIRAMEKRKPPIRLIAPGRVYRCDSDVTHTPMFHQVEGLFVDEQVTFANLKALLHDFLQAFFNQSLNLRFRPSYFPFTEPSAEVDISCVLCEAKGCRVCKQTGWLEVLGCGMVHPNVLKNVNIDPEVYSGWAFGAGIDRLAMLRYGVDDLRAFFESDLRFLQQFAWS